MSTVIRAGARFLTRPMTCPAWSVRVLVLAIATTAAASGIALGQDCEGLVEIPDSRFAAARDGTVKDKATGLMWKQCAEGLSGVGCAVGEPLDFKWRQAIDQGADTALVRLLPH